MYSLNDVLHSRENESTTTVCNSMDKSHNIMLSIKKEKSISRLYTNTTNTGQYIIQTHLSDKTIIWKGNEKSKR